MLVLVGVLALACAVFGQADIELTNPSGEFESPNYSSGEGYPHNERIGWRIRGQAGKAIRLTFDKHFSVDREQCTDCSCDSVTVYAGADQSAPIMVKACGTVAPLTQVTTDTDMYVLFVSDDYQQRAGFKASYEVTCPGAMCNSGQCIPAAALCDDVPDCDDGSDESAQTCECGVPANTPNMPSNFRIVGGQEARPHSYPWMVALMGNSAGSSSQYCGGSIIDEQWILTAAHCVEGDSASSVHVKAGAHVKYSGSEGAVMRTASRLFIHHSYDTSNLDSDIALIKLATPLEFGANINKVCLPSSDVVAEGEGLVVTGWGTLSEGGSSSSNLMEVTVPRISNSQCGEMYGSSYPITDTMMCAGLSEGGKDSCQGDSGGPVVHSNTGTNSGTFTQVGVVSWGIGCARAGYPGVYAKVHALMPWISDTMANN